MKGHQITVCKAVRIVSTSIEKVRKILHKEFQTKSCVRDGCCDCWLRTNGTCKRTFPWRAWQFVISIYQNCVLRFVTMKETRIPHYSPVSKHQSTQRTALDESTPAKAISLAGIVLATAFWDSQGTIFIGYLQNGKTITDEYYAMSLVCLKEKLERKKKTEKKSPDWCTRKCSFTKTTVLFHKSTIVMAKFSELSIGS